MSEVVVRRAAENRDLALVDTVVQLLDLSAEDDIAQIKRLLPAASRAVEKYTGRVLARELITEKLGLDDLDVGAIGGARGTFRVMLARRPLLLVEAVRLDGEPIDLESVEIEDSEAGFLFARSGFAATTIFAQQLEPVRTGFKSPLYEVDYAAGYVLPSFDAISLDLAPSAFDTSTGVITAATHGLVSGDSVRLSPSDGGTLPAGLVEYRDYYVRDYTSGTFKLADKRNGPALAFTSTGTGTHNVERRITLPEDIQDAVVQLVSNRYINRKATRQVKSESLGDYSVTYTDAAEVISGIPSEIRSVLDSYREII